MGVTVTRRDLLLGVGGVVLFVAVALAARWRGGPQEPLELATPENPLVIEAPSLLVAVGVDTTRIYGPTLFVFAGLPEVEEGTPPPPVPEGSVAFLEVVAAARERLSAMGVQTVGVAAPPEALGVPSDVDAAAGPRIAASGVGLLLADGRGRIRRLDRVADATTLVCAAAGTFRLRPPPELDGVCPP